MCQHINYRSRKETRNRYVRFCRKPVIHVVITLLSKSGAMLSFAVPVSLYATPYRCKDSIALQSPAY